MSTWPPVIHQDVQDEVGSHRTQLATIAATGATGAPAVSPQSGTFFSPNLMRQFSGPVQPPVGRLDASMLILARTITLAGLTMQVSTAGDASSVVRLGVYADSGDHYPGALLLDAGTVGTSTTGRKTATASLSMPAGIYWLTAAVQGATTIPFCISMSRGAGSYYSLFGDPNADPGFFFVGTDNSATSEGFTMTGVTGALPSNFSSTRTRFNNTNMMIVGQAA